MTIYRGPGGTGSATSDADTTIYQDFLNQTEAAKNAAAVSATNASTSASTAATQASNAASSATNAASSATSASTSATTATTKASEASSSATAAASSATAAAGSASSASTSATNASNSATAAATSATNAASSASAASTSQTAAASSASSASTSATNAASSASSASTSATNASNSASSASTSATNASNSATAAASSASSASVSASAANASAVAAAASAASINPALFMHLAGTETVTGSKTFSSLITGDISGTASNVRGTVAAANGGTGLTSVGASGNVLTSNGTTWVSQAPTVAVTSVGATAPVSSSGGTTPTISLASGYGDTQNPFASKTANSFLAAPNGTAGAPSFRAIVAADIPTLNQNTTGTASNVTGTVAVANGGTGSTTLAANNVLLGNGTSALQAVAPGASGNLLTSNGTTWVSSTPPSGGQYYGSAATKAIAYNSDTIGENITISAGTNGLSAGPITINTGFTVTVNGTWTIV